MRNTRAFFNLFNIFNMLNRGGLCRPPLPLQEELESSPAPGWKLLFVAVTTKPIKPQGFFLNRLPPASRAPPIYRTAQARQALDLRSVLQRIAVMQIGATQPQTVDYSNLQTTNAKGRFKWILI